MDDKARKEKLKQERKELRKAKKLERQRRLEEQEDKNPLEWFSLKGIRQEIKNVHWLTKKELARDAFVVLAFTVILGVYFYGADALIALILKTLGLS